MINISDITHQLTVNAEAIRTLVETVSEEQARWSPDPETWSLEKVMEHLYNEERLDFRKHLKEMLSIPPRPWEKFNPDEHSHLESLHQGLEGFMSERKASLAWINALQVPDWDVASPTPFAPDGEKLVLKAGDVLVSWLAHDHLHLRQINELLFAWNEKRARPYSVQYAGEW
jgi:hypothetical protein